MRAVSRAADYTLLVLEIDAEFDEGCQQSRRLHPDDNEDGESGGDKGPSAEPPTAPFTIRTLPRALRPRSLHRLALHSRAVVWGWQWSHIFAAGWRPHFSAWHQRPRYVAASDDA